MLKYDEKNNRLLAYKHEVAIPPAPVRETSWERRSFDRYIAERIEQDVREEFFPRLLETLKCEPNALHLLDVKVVQEKSNYWANKDWKVKVGFRTWGMNPADRKYLTIMSLPYVEDDGRIYQDRKYYSYIKVLEQEPTVSYEDKSPEDKVLKVKMPRGFLSVLYSARGPKLQLSDIKSKSSRTNFDLLTALFAMARKEGYDQQALWDEFRNLVIKSIPKTQEDLDNYFWGLGSNTGSINNISYDDQVVTRLMGLPIEDTSRLGADGSPRTIVLTNYQTKDVRDCLNQILSLDRAIGAVLGENVYSVTTPNKLLFRAGITITKNVIDTCVANGVYKLYIDKRANVEGYYLGESVILPFIPKGVKMIPELEAYLPEEKGMYVSKDYRFEGANTPMLTDTYKLNKDLVNVLCACGYSSVKLCDKPGRAFHPSEEGKFTLYFTEEVLSNRMFLASSVGRTDLGTEWVYLNAEGQFVPCPEYWTTYDLAAMLSLAVKLYGGECHHVVTNADTGFRKKIVTVEELYSRAFRHACIYGLSKIGNSLRGIWQNGVKRMEFLEESTSEKFYALTKKFWEYISNDMDCLELLSNDAITNPLSYISALTKMKVVVGSKHAVADSQRRIAIGSYARTDAFEIPQSHKLGVVLNLCIDCKVDLDGNMLVGYRELIHDGMQTRLSDKITYLSVAEEEQYRIADIGSIEWDKDGICRDNTKMVLARCPAATTLDKQSFTYIRIRQCKYVNAHANQPLSWSSAAIAHLDANDGNRATFGIAQAKQAKGQVETQAPRVGTSANLYIPTLTDYFCIVAKKPGTVESVVVNYNRIKDVDEVTDTLAEPFSFALHVRYDDDTTDIFEIDEITNSGYSVCVRKLLVEDGQHFEKGDVLVTSNFMDGDCMALGKNMLVGYVPTGKNYEDGMNASVAACEKMTSYKLYETFSENVNFKHATSYRVTQAVYGKYIDPTTENFATVSIQTRKTKGETFPRPVTVDKGHGFLEKCTERVSTTNYGRSVYDGVDVSFLAINAFSNGDKGSNRHGNKGVMPSPEPNSTMMRLPNGMILDIAYNPHGVTSRMNIGQTREANLGLCMHILDTYCITDPFNGITADEIKMLLKYVWELANSTGDPMIICNKYPDIPKGLHKRACERIRKIRAWADTFDERGECYLYDPLTGKMTETKALIGINYVFKLIQESDSKIHARAGYMAGEPYARISGGATKGSSNHGGQRFGTMEMDGLCAYGVANLIHELTNERGDNPVARSNMNAKKFLPDELVDDYLIDSPGQRRSTTQLLYTMLALGMHTDCDEGEFIDLSRDNCDLGYYSSQTLRKIDSDLDKKDKEKRKTSTSGNGSTSSTPNSFVAPDSVREELGAPKKPNNGTFTMDEAMSVLSEYGLDVT